MNKLHDLHGLQALIGTCDEFPKTWRDEYLGQPRETNMRETYDIWIGRVHPRGEFRLELKLQTLDVETHAQLPPELFRKALNAAGREATKVITEALNEGHTHGFGERKDE